MKFSTCPLRRTTSFRSLDLRSISYNPTKMPRLISCRKIWIWRLNKLRECRGSKDTRTNSIMRASTAIKIELFLFKPSNKISSKTRKRSDKNWRKISNACRQHSSMQTTMLKFFSRKMFSCVKIILECTSSYILSKTSSLLKLKSLSWR